MNDPTPANRPATPAEQQQAIDAFNRLPAVRKLHARAFLQYAASVLTTYGDPPDGRLCLTEATCPPTGPACYLCAVDRAVTRFADGDPATDYLRTGTHVKQLLLDRLWQQPIAPDATPAGHASAVAMALAVDITRGSLRPQPAHLS